MDATRFELGGEPLSTWIGPDSAAGDVDEAPLEYTSRGDRVPARLLRPRAPGPHPLVLALHGRGGHKAADYMDAAVLPWVRQGAAVLCIDLPLHGERHSAKMSERVTGDRAADPSLWRAMVEQGVVDLRRGLRAAAEQEAVDGGRVAFAGFSLGTIVGTVFCAVEPRVQAAALAIGGGGLGPAEVDPVRWAGAIAPRPVLFVNAEDDETIPRASAEALHAAAPHARVEWYPCGHRDLPGRALRSMWHFLRDAL